ncbi:cupin domain-containing protein [Algoriphagus sp. D3-2-R+10]|uniref:cupin domain-containing protein n=1 Tax=Algoriphagus aurantiacus TaxID=3103948 RepID=UPI002B3C78CC|nr:cupin domain-containing protein [Algoriphagus sp. D3-2-R+10]MEB2776548.1 cupin domain-containing protein [Algoriphagus sp. D3-2-R+10]
MEKVNINEKFDLIKELWSPKIIGELNGQDVKLAKVQGEFVWHNHTNEDELFLIIKGTLKIDLEGESITLNEGEMLVIPRGVEHSLWQKRKHGFYCSNLKARSIPEK